MYLCLLFMYEPPDQSPPNFAQTSTPIQGRFLTQVWPRQPDPLTPNSKTLADHWSFTKNVQMGDLPNLIKFFPGNARPQLANLSYSSETLKKIFLILKLCFVSRGHLRHTRWSWFFLLVTPGGSQTWAASMEILWGTNLATLNPFHSGWWLCTL